jgi:hypothetical protein
MADLVDLKTVTNLITFSSLSSSVFIHRVQPHLVHSINNTVHGNLSLQMTQGQAA